MKFLILLLIDMLFVLNCRITIGTAVFTGVYDVVISHSIHQVVQTARISLPLSARLHYDGKIESVSTHQVFKIGDPVSIELGYNGQLFPEFNGYVVRLVYGQPMTIECEDAMFILRKNHITASEENIPLKDVVAMCLNGLFPVEGEIPNTPINEFTHYQKPAVDVLQQLRDDFGLSIFFTAQAKLYCGLRYGFRSGEERFDFHQNIKPQANQLGYQSEDDVRLRIIARSWRKDGTLLEEEIGDTDGHQRTLWFYGIEDQGTLKERALAEIGRYKFTGYTGYFTTWLYPYSEPGMMAVITDPDFPERAGSYYIDSVETRFGVSGASRKIEPGIKLD